MTEAERKLVEVALVWQDWHPRYSWGRGSEMQLYDAVDAVKKERKEYERHQASDRLAAGIRDSLKRDH